MSSAQLNAGQTKAETQAKTESFVESAKSNASAGHDKVAEMANADPSTTQAQKDKGASFIQQSGEQIINMAQGAQNMAAGAIDGIKNTLGVGEHQNEKK